MRVIISLSSVNYSQKKGLKLYLITRWARSEGLSSNIIRESITHTLKALETLSSRLNLLKYIPQRVSQAIIKALGL